MAVADGPVEVLLHPESSEADLWVGVPALSDDLRHRPEHLHQRSREQWRPFESTQLQLPQYVQVHA